MTFIQSIILHIHAHYMGVEFSFADLRDFGTNAGRSRCTISNAIKTLAKRGLIVSTGKLTNAGNGIRSKVYRANNGALAAEVNAILDRQQQPHKKYVRDLSRSRQQAIQREQEEARRNAMLATAANNIEAALNRITQNNRRLYAQD